MDEPSWLPAVTADPTIGDVAVLPRRAGEPLTVLVRPQGFSYGPVIRGVIRAAAPAEDDLRVVLVTDVPRHDGSVDLGAARTLAEQTPYVFTYRPAGTSAEEALLAEISALFPELEVSVTDSLADLGGDSLTAMLLVERLEERHGVAVDPSDLFAAESFRQLAASTTGLPAEG